MDDGDDDIVFQGMRTAAELSSERLREAKSKGLVISTCEDSPDVEQESLSRTIGVWCVTWHGGAVLRAGIDKTSEQKRIIKAGVEVQVVEIIFPRARVLDMMGAELGWISLQASNGKQIAQRLRNLPKKPRRKLLPVPQLQDDEDDASPATTDNESHGEYPQNGHVGNSRHHEKDEEEEAVKARHSSRKNAPHPETTRGRKRVISDGVLKTEGGGGWKRVRTTAKNASAIVVRGRETPISAVALEKEEARKMRTGILHGDDDSDDDVDADDDDDDDVGEEEEEKVKTRFSQLLREKGLGGLAAPRCIGMLSLELLTQRSIDAGVVTEILAGEWGVSGEAKKAALKEVIIEARTKCNCASASPKALSPTTTTTDLKEPAASADYDLPSESDPIGTAQDVFGGVDMESYTGKS
mmetsp:Transcript_14572/g.23153  ORF Transcript_14572/g.23153 Transcript_14572/m.23153 type:complete len:411 (+) Transcript_14572:62-1294(+)